MDKIKDRKNKRLVDMNQKRKKKVVSLDFKEVKRYLSLASRFQNGEMGHGKKYYERY